MKSRSASEDDMGVTRLNGEGYWLGRGPAAGKAGGDFGGWSRQVCR